MGATRKPAPRSAGGGRTAGATVVIGLLAALGWTVPVVGPVLPTAVGASVLTLAPVLVGWGLGWQTLVALAAVAAFAWGGLDVLAVTLAEVGLLAGLLVGAAVSLVAAAALGRRLESERGERRELADRVRRGLATLGARAGAGEVVAGDARAGGGSERETVLATMERLARELETVRAQANKEIEHEREMNAHFIGLAAHEFRTPLAVIQTAAEGLKLYGGRMSSSVQYARLCKIEEAVQHMLTLLRNALSFSKLGTSQVKYERQAVDLRALAHQVVRAVQNDLGERQIKLTVRGEARLPQLDPSLTLEILTNLLTNAVKYSPADAPVDLDIAIESSEVRIRVVDRGIGIATADQPHVFELFRRGSNVGDVAGTGIGLAITKRAVDMHGGTITLDSSPERGTTITAVLPERVQAPPVRKSA